MRTKTLNTWLCGQDSPYPKSVNPIDVVNKDFPPTLVIVATEDKLIDPAESYDVVSKLKSVGVDARFLEARGMTHGIAEDGRETWPEDQDWWNEAILPGLEWIVKMTRA
jgi:acetyl esterase/lipase